MYVSACEFRGHVFRPVCLQSAMAYRAKADLFLQIVLERRK